MTTFAHTEELIEVLKTLKSLSSEIELAADKCAAALAGGGKLLIMGNGGSAADSQHIAAEFVGRYKLERKGLPAIALTTDTSILTSVGNDYSFEDVFSRQVTALARKGDVVIGLSTSGNSKNVIKAVEAAKQAGALTICFLGCGGGKLKPMSDIAITIPSSHTPRIQECHIHIAHIICEQVELKLKNNAGV